MAKQTSKTTSPAKNKVAIYARVSTSDKQDFSRQINELTDIITSDGYSKTDIDVYAESLSGYNKERPKLSELIAKVEENPKAYDCIYTAEITRIGRNPVHTRQVIDRWSDLKVPLYIQSLSQRTLDSQGIRNSTMNIVLQVLIEYANLEAETFKIRSKSGLRASAMEGKAGGGLMQAYGYTKDEYGYLVIDNEEALIVNDIFNLYEKGNGIRVIAGTLNKRGVPTRTNKTHSDKEIKFQTSAKLGKDVKWSDKQIHDIIKNTLYIGERKFKGEIIKAPAIISKELFESCTEIRTGKTQTNQRKYVYLLKDKITCGVCGRNYFAKYKPVEGGDKVYICSGRLQHTNCGNVGVNITLLESAIFNVIIDDNQILKYLNDNNSIIKDLRNEIEKLELRIPIEEMNLTQQKSKMSKLLDLYLSSEMKYMNLEERQAELENEINNAIERVFQLKKQLVEKNESLTKFSSPKGTKHTLAKAKSSRSDLAAIYKQFITKVCIDKIDAYTVVAGVYMQINGVLLPNPLLMLLDLSGIRRKPMEYRCKVMYSNGKPNEEAEIVDYDHFEYVDWINIPSDKLIQL